MARQNNQSRQPVPIAGARLDDDSLLEMVVHPQTNETAFLHFADTRMTLLKNFTVPGVGAVVPFSPTNNLLAHNVILFSSTATEYGTEHSLLDDVRSFVHRYADLSESFEEVASLYVLLSWVYDRFSVLPYLRFRGEYGTGKSRCLQVVGSLCYKPMFVSGASTVSPMFRIIDAFRGTLVLDESDFRFSDERAEIVKILNNGNAAGFPVLRSEAAPTKEFNPRAFAVFGPKVIATRRDFDDLALESRCITEVMTGLPPRADIPLSLPEPFNTEALELRNRLLMYRFRNATRREAMTDARDPLLEARVAQVFAPLACIAPDHATRDRVLNLAKKQTAILRSDRSTSTEAQLLDTLYGMRCDGAALYIRDIAARFASSFGTDYERPITARWIGSQLRKRLSLVPVKSHGTYLIPEGEQPKLDVLFARFHIADAGTDNRAALGTLEMF